MENSKRIDKEKQKQIRKQNETVADDYLIRAVQEKNLLYLSFYLHGYEHRLNGKVYSFLRRNGMDTYDPVLFLDMKGKLFGLQTGISPDPGYMPGQQSAI